MAAAVGRVRAGAVAADTAAVGAAASAAVAVGAAAAVAAGAAAAAASAAAARRDDGELSAPNRCVISRCPAGACAAPSTRATLQAIEQAITDTERAHGGEIRFAVEASREPARLDARRHSAATAQWQAFAQLGVWDTEANNGVLIYVSWADRDVEIVADRGFNGRVTDQEWAEVCRRMEQSFARGAPRQAVVEGIQAVGALIARHFPTADRDELPNRPVML